MRVVLVPGVLALLPEYASLEDPVGPLRAACLDAVSWLGRDVTVLGGAAVADHLLGVTERAGDVPSYLVVGNGSAKRTEKAPGHVDDRAVPFDPALGDALVGGRPADLDLGLSGELWADTAAIADLARVLPPGLPATVDLDADPFGVQYWVARWEW